MDDRFSHVFKDPRFQRVPVKERKLKIDKRFKGMFKDKRFSLKYTVDKRGRPIKSSTSENLQKYYQLSDEDEDGETDEDEDALSSSEDEKKSKKKEKQVKKKKKKEIEKKTKKSISNGADSKTDAGIVLDAEKSVDSSIENKKIGKGLTKKIIDDTQRKRKLSSTEDALLTSSKKLKKKPKKKIVEEVIEAEEKEKEEEDDDKEEEDEKDEEEEDASEDEESEDSESGLGSGPDLARGIGNETSSSEDSDSDSESDDEAAAAAVEEIVHDWGEFDKDVALTSDLTRRLAACNMDWDNLTAEDIFVVVNSFKPPEGVLLSVKIFLSDFGKERLEEEVSKGPAELAQIAQDDNECIEDESQANEENSEGNSFHNEKLREYQLKRMKYYYAVIECDTVETANRIYSELDGAEYESSKTCFDLRFIPDDMEFEDEAKDICTQLPNKDLYKPNQFLSTALSEAEVALTWDETNRKRLETTTKNYNKKSEIKLEDFKDYLALSSEDEEDAEKNGSDASLISDNELSDDDDDDDVDSNDEGVKSNIKKYKKLLEGIEETERKKEDKQLEVTWDIGLKEKTEEALKTKEKKKNASPWNEFLEKVKEKKKKRKAKLKALKKTAESKEPQPTFSDDDIPSDVDFNDPYFKSELISDPNQKSKTQKKKEKKAKRLKKLEGETDSGLTAEEKEQRKQEMAELALLMADEDDINPKAHFDYEKIIKKENKKKSKKNIKAAKEKDDFKLELNDERFSSIYTSSAFNIDRSAPEYKKSAAMEALIEEKLRRRYIEKEFPEKEQKSSKLPIDKPVASRPSTSINQSVDSLVRSIKTKTKNFNFSKTKPNIKSHIWKKMPKDL